MIDEPVHTSAAGSVSSPRAPVPAAAGERPIPDRRMARALWLVLIASIIGLFPFTIYSTFLVPIAATARTPESGIGFLRGLGGLAALVAGIALAPLLGRWPKRYVTVAALLLLATAGVLATTGTFAALTVFCLAVGVATALLTPALLALATSRFSGPGDIGRAATMVTATQSLAAVCAGPVIGVMGSWYGWQGALWITAALSVLIAAGFLLDRPRAVASSAPAAVPLGYAASFRAVRAQPGLLALIAVAGLRTASFMGYLAFLAVFYDDRFALTPATFTAVWTLSGASFFLGNYLTGRWVRDPGSVLGRHPRTVLSAGLLGALIAVLGVFHTSALLPALAATTLMGFGHAVVAAQVTTSIARRSGDLSAIAFSLNAAGMSLGVFGGALLGGAGLAAAGHTGLALALSLPTILALLLVPAAGARRDEAGPFAPATPRTPSPPGDPLPRAAADRPARRRTRLPRHPTGFRVPNNMKSEERNRGTAMRDGSEYSASAEYLHLLSMSAWAGMSGRVAAALRGTDFAVGTVVEFGAGTGLATDVLLDIAAPAPILAAEPSPQLRAVLLARLSGRGDRDRITVFPGGAAELPLPERVAAVVGINMIGHLAPECRRALFSELMPRLAPGAPVVFNVQPPDTAVEVPEWPPIAVTVGGLRYEGTGRAVPTGPDRVRWTMSYRTVDGDTELAHASAEYDWWIVSAEGLAAELRHAGAAVVRVDGDLVIARSSAVE